MLSLDDDRWSELAHCYGPAADVPDLLRALARREDIAAQRRGLDLWDRIWSALCHQGDVYSASYAAVPHVVDIGLRRPAAEQPAFWTFVGAVAGATDAAPIPPDLAPAYRRALEQADAAARAAIVPGITDDDALALLIALTAIRRQPLLAAALEGLRDADLQQECADCGLELHVITTALPFIVSDRDPTDASPARTTPVTPKRAPSPDVHAIATAARRAGLDDLAARITALDALVTCPACGARFPLLS